MRWRFVVLLAACAAPGSGAPRSHDAPAAVQRPASSERRYAIWLGGAQVGTAEETEAWSATGVIVRRREAMRYLRGDVAVALAMTIEITADPALVPSRVTWIEQAQATRHGEAVRDATGWTVTDDAGVRRLPDLAIPAELAPLIVRRDGRFEGPVFLPARGFLAGAGRIEPVAPGRLVARLVFAPGAAAEATIDLGDDGMPIRVVDGEGVIATRITAAEAERPFTPVDLIAATAIALTGAPSHRLRLDGELAVPPVPGQRTQIVADGAVIELSARLAGDLPPGALGADRTREIAALVRRVRGRIAPDLAADPSSARTAAAATSGDCTTFALAYTALAGERAIPTLVVTGFRVDHDRLVRHRWAVSWTGRAWIAVDAAFGAVPAGGDLVGLAIHDADDLGLVAGEAALTHVRAASWK
ncbi:MAG: transglutaminase domain-containing protein [Kofleriaceae bacterium]